MAFKIQNNIGKNYGPIPTDYVFDVPNGYSVFIGKNDAGKSCLLQLIFRELINSGSIGKDKIGFIPADRSYIRNTTQPPTTLEQFNTNLFGQIQNEPRTYESQKIFEADALYSLFLHRTDLIRQVNEINQYMLRLGFDQIILKSTQIATIGDVHVVSHGTGVRSVLPIVAALTSQDIEVVIVDEPEIALEARSQKVLKELFVEAAERKKTIVIATQSHIFINKQDPSKNYIVDSSTGMTTVKQVSDKSGLLNITFNLLGNSLEDLFFPSNFLIVEGSSDQVICERVALLLDIPSDRVKIIAARGIDNIQDSHKAICNTLIPLVAGKSPYAKRVVVLVDNPQPQSAPSVERLNRQLKKRCIVLKENSIEEHIPEKLYAKAGMKRAEILNRIADLKQALRHGQQGETLKDLENLKKSISSSIASSLELKDLKLIPTITEAVRLAAKNVAI